MDDRGRMILGGFLLVATFVVWGIFQFSGDDDGDDPGRRRGPAAAIGTRAPGANVQGYALHVEGVTGDRDTWARLLAIELGNVSDGPAIDATTGSGAMGIITVKISAESETYQVKPRGAAAARSVAVPQKVTFTITVKSFGEKSTWDGSRTYAAEKRTGDSFKARGGELAASSVVRNQIQYFAEKLAEHIEDDLGELDR